MNFLKKIKFPYFRVGMQALLGANFKNGIVLFIFGLMPLSSAFSNGMWLETFNGKLGETASKACENSWWYWYGGIVPYGDGYKCIWGKLAGPSLAGTVAEVSYVRLYTPCDPGSTVVNGVCVTNQSCPVGTVDATSCKPNKNQGYSCDSNGEFTSHPIHTSTGNKYLGERDYLAAYPVQVNFLRFYNSQNTAAKSSLGTSWRHRYDSSVTRNLTINNSPAVLMARANGIAYAFTVNGTSYISQDADVTDELEALLDANGNVTGWTYKVASDNSVERYDASGRLLSIKDRVGNLHLLTHSDNTTPTTVAPKAGLLIRVSDSFGRQLNFTYDSVGRITKMTDPAGGQYVYAYDATNNLMSVTYPDGKIKTYRYNEPAYTGDANLPHALTGIEDENGIRYVSYWYDSQGRAYKEELVGGVDRYQISYGSDGSNSIITDPLGTVRTTHFTTILGSIKATGQSQPGGSGCGPASSAITYDAHGNVASRTDFNGAKVCYAYDLARNLETTRVEGVPAEADCASALLSNSLAAPARRITTQWHAQYRLPTLIAEPQRLTSHEHDPQGNVLSKTVWATTDTTGTVGAAANAVGVPRRWSYTYNQYGQVLTATGPRTDVADTTTYAYDDATGNLLSITNAAGHVMTYSNYDANGRVGRIVDANGLTTDLTYTPRGWLKARTVTGHGVSELTTYDYDGVGQLKKVSLPDGAWVGYTYDDAHRLTEIVDSAGNAIHYTLDAMGNRVKEEVKDPNGALARQTSRIYDALNRLQEITGGTQ